MAREVTVATETYRLPERVLNAGASVLQTLGLPFTTLDTDEMMRSAQRETGLEDFGSSDFEGPLRTLISLLEGKGITPLAHIVSRSILRKALVNRLLMEQYLKEHPEVLDVPIERPIFVVGFPRTGTTVLQNLLALPDDRRALEFWELTAPVPQFDDPAEDARRRIAQINRMLRVAYLMAPEMGAVHAIQATTAEEDWSLFANTGAVLNYDFQSGIAAFGQYLFDQDMTWAYKEFRRSLQLLLFQRPASQLVLKCPEHLWFLDALLEVFPDACVVWPHRDPFDAVASYCSLISMNRRVYYGKYVPAELGPYIVERFHLGIERALAARARHGDDNFLDLRFVDLVKDQAGTVRQIEEHFGLDHAADTDARVAAWLRGRREDKRGAHVYDAARYGLDRDALHARYADYIERFDIPLDT